MSQLYTRDECSTTHELFGYFV